MTGSTADVQDSDEEFAAMFEACKNWGKWGADDQLGTVNYITADVRLAAAAVVRSGESFSVCRPLAKGPGDGNHPRVDHHMAMFPGAPGTYDYVGIYNHGRYLTHLDALGHGIWEGRTYNGHVLTTTPDEVLGYGASAPGGISHDGLEVCGLEQYRDGIFTRGVLLDVAAANGVTHVGRDHAVTAEELDKAEKHAGVTVRRGDAVFVRAGVMHPDASFDLGRDYAVRPGIVASACRWMHEREIAVYTGDVIDKAPYRSRRFPTPFHQIALCAMGLALLDWSDVETLARRCEQAGRSEFLLTVAPVPVRGSTGGAVNPIITF
jgi:hypothetical protein